jgi:hypothetical protein
MDPVLIKLQKAFGVSDRAEPEAYQLIEHLFDLDPHDQAKAMGVIAIRLWSDVLSGAELPLEADRFLYYTKYDFEVDRPGTRNFTKSLSVDQLSALRLLVLSIVPRLGNDFYLEKICFTVARHVERRLTKA